MGKLIGRKIVQVELKTTVMVAETSSMKPEVEEHLKSTRFTRVAADYWKADNPGLRGFRTHGRTEQECRENARTELEWYLKAKKMSRPQ